MDFVVIIFKQLQRCGCFLFENRKEDTMAIIEPHEYKGEAIEMTLTGKELSEMISNNPDTEFVVSFDFRTPVTKKEKIRRRVIIYESDA